jgi:hypothetical protein
MIFTRKHYWRLLYPPFPHLQIQAFAMSFDLKQESEHKVLQGGLEEILMSAGGEQAKTAAFWSWNQNGEVSKKKSSGGHSIVWVVLLILVFVAALAFVAAVKVHQSRRGLSQYLDLNSMGYTPPIL